MTRIYTGDSSGWTENRVENLKLWWAAGLSATQIGVSLGVTRNAVIGKVQRLGIAERAMTPKHARQQNGKVQGKARAGKVKAESRRIANIIRWQETCPVPEPVPLPRQLQATTRAARANIHAAPSIPPAPDCTPIDIDALNSRVCHWPFEPEGDEGWRYCGAPRDPHSHAYCRHHHARAIDPISRQRFLSRRA